MAEEPIVVRGNTGLQTLLGYEARVFADRSEVHLDVEERHLNRRGTLHGGLFAVIADSACGYAASRTLSPDASQQVVTLSMTMNYLSPGRTGSIIATGRVTKAGYKTVFAEAEVRDENGALLATGSGVFKRAS